MTLRLLMCFTILFVSFSGLANAACIVVINHGVEQTTRTLDTGERAVYAGRPFFELRNIGAQDIQVELAHYVTREQLPTRTINGSGGSYVIASRLNAMTCLETMNQTENPAEDVANQLAEQARATLNSAAEFQREAIRGVERLVTRIACPLNLGNEDRQNSGASSNVFLNRGARGNLNKFRNFEIQSGFSVMNNYLLMQASNKTYWQQLKYGRGDNDHWRRVQNNFEMRCALQELYRYWGMDNAYLLNAAPSGANAVVSVDNEKLIIAVRGTQNPMGVINTSAPDPVEAISGMLDIRDNMSNMPIPSNVLNMGTRGRVHTGYAGAAEALYWQVATLMKVQGWENKDVFITGHSLGGATATLLAAKMERLGYRVRAAYVFAPPKVGDLAFYDDLKQRVPLYVTINYRDPVPTFLRSDHIGVAISFGIIESLKYLAPTAEAAREVVYFTHSHDAVYMNDESHSRQERNLLMREDQGGPYPDILLSQGLMSDEWHFHNGNFYVAFTYNEVLRQRLRTAQGTRIEPEFHKQAMCLVWEKTNDTFVVDWNVNYQRFMRDKNSYPFQRCVW